METLSCNNCGGMIELPDTTNYVTCVRCGAHLVVRRGEAARYTEVLGNSDAVQHATDTEAELGRLRIEMAIMALDQEWEGRRTQLMVHNRYGAEIEPGMSQVALCLLGSLALPVGAVYAMIRWHIEMYPGSCFLLLVTVIPSLLLARVALLTYLKYKEYLAAENAYMDRRDALISQRWEQQKRLSS